MYFRCFVIVCFGTNAKIPGILPYIGYTGICRWKGYGFQAIWSGIGSSNHKKLVKYRVPFNGIAHKRLKSRTIEHF